MQKSFEFFQIKKTLMRKKKIFISWRLKYHNNIQYLDKKIRSKLFYVENLFKKAYINWKKQTYENLHHKNLKKQSILYYLRMSMKKVWTSFFLNYKKNQTQRLKFECISANDNVRILKQYLNLWHDTSKKFEISKNFRNKNVQKKVLKILIENFNELKNKQTMAKSFNELKKLEKTKTIFNRLIYFFNDAMKKRSNHKNADEYFYIKQIKKKFFLLKEVYFERLEFYKKIKIFHKLSFKKNALYSWRKYLTHKHLLRNLSIQFGEEKIVKVKKFAFNKWMSNFNETLYDKEKATRSHFFYVNKLKRKLLYELTIFKTGSKYEKSKIHQIINLRRVIFLKLWFNQSLYETTIKDLMFRKYLRIASKFLMNLKNYSTKRKMKNISCHKALIFFKRKFFRSLKSFWMFRSNKNNHHLHLFDLISYRKKEKCFKNLQCYFLIKLEKRKIIGGILEKKRQQIFRAFFDKLTYSDNAIKYELAHQFRLKINLKLMRRMMGLLYKNKVNRRGKKEYCEKIAGYFNLKKISKMFNLLKNPVLKYDHKQLLLIIGRLILKNKQNIFKKYSNFKINFIV